VWGPGFRRRSLVRNALCPHERLREPLSARARACLRLCARAAPHVMAEASLLDGLRIEEETCVRVPARRAPARRHVTRVGRVACAVEQRRCHGVEGRRRDRPGAHACRQRELHRRDGRGPAWRERDGRGGGRDEGGAARLIDHVKAHSCRCGACAQVLRLSRERNDAAAIRGQLRRHEERCLDKAELRKAHEPNLADEARATVPVAAKRRG
jgi:hypothetical protein